MWNRVIDEAMANARAANPGAVVLVRIGDLFKAFDRDAKVLVQVDKGLMIEIQNDRHTVKFPQQYRNQYVAKLVASGYRVVILDQMRPW